jgi:hypothetical protein
MAIRKRRHHNTKGLRQIKLDNCANQVKRIARKLKIPYDKLTQ